MHWLKSFQFRFMIIGVVVGIFLPIIGTIIEAETDFHRIDLKSFIEVQRTQPLMWLLDTVPFFLGILAAVVGASRDAILKTNANLQSSRNQYAALFNQSSEGIMLTDPATGNIIKANPALCALFGYSQEEVVGTSIRDYIPESHKDDFVKLYDVLERDGIFKIETERDKKDGTRFWVENVITLVQTDKGKLLQSSIRDISDRKVLEESEARLRHMFDNSKDIVCLHLPNGTYVDVSPSMKQIAGYEPAELLGTNAYSLFHPEDLHQIMPNTKVERLAELGRGIIEYRFKHKQGHYIWLETINEPVLIGNKQVKYMMTSSRDVTQRKTAEQERDQLLHELEQRVEDRTLKLSEANDQLNQQNKDINDSIRYALRLQQAILPEDRILNEAFPEAFVYYNPRDVVSGDFYWWCGSHDRFLLVAADCTGHGVPAAFMSVVGIKSLKRVLASHPDADASSILSLIDQELDDLFSKDGIKVIKDGMDVAVCWIDTNTRTIEFAGAARPAVLISQGELTQYRGNKYSLGGILPPDEKDYRSVTIPYRPGDMLYLFSDGYPDQFGGASDKKFMMARFKQMLLDIHTLPATRQNEMLHTSFADWKGDGFQVDDVLVMGVRL